MNDEYGVQSSDGENVLNALRANKENEFLKTKHKIVHHHIHQALSRKKEVSKVKTMITLISMLWSKLWKGKSYLIQKLLKMHLNDLLNKVKQNIDKKYDKPMKKCQVALQEKLELHKKKHPMLKLVYLIAPVQRKAATKNQWRALTRIYVERFMIITGV